MSSDSAPDVLEVYVGSFASPSYGLWWDGKQLVYESFVSGYEDRLQTFVAPSDAQWSRFWQTMDAIDVWGWRDHYEASVPVERTTQIRDRTHWSLTIARGDRRIESSGEDAGPGAGFEEGGPFTTFAAAVSRLTGGYAFG